MSADEQADLLKDRCRYVASLSGGKMRHQYPREQLFKLAQPGRGLVMVYPFLLADPKARGAPQMKASFRETIDYLVNKRRVVIEDVYGDLSTEKPGQLRALIALGEKMIGRSCQGAKSAENGKQGNQLAEFSKAAEAEAKLIWRDMIEFPTWDDCAAAYMLLDEKYKHKDPWTVWRSHSEWGKRRPAKRKR